MSALPQRPPLRYRGGKWRIARDLIALFPPHECYVEPFAGGASVLLRKEPADFEVLNDLDGAVVAFWRCLRDRPQELERAIMLTPSSRAEYRAALDDAADDLELARRFYVRTWQGRGSATGHGGWRFQKAWNGWKANMPRLFHDLGHFGPVAARIQHVQLEQDTAVRVIERWDAPGTLFYVDPPYVWSTREKSRRLYGHEMTDADHLALAEVLHRVQGMVVLSGYDSPLYRELYARWETVRIETNAEASKKAVEWVWLSPRTTAAMPQLDLFREATP